MGRVPVGDRGGSPALHPSTGDCSRWSSCRDWGSPPTIGGYRTANQVAGDRKATGLSLFSIGGNIGIALGPLAVFSFPIRPAGHPRAPGAGLLVAALIALALPALVSAPARSARAMRRRGRRDMRGAMALLIGVVTVRAWTQFGLVTFVPFLWTSSGRIRASSGRSCSSSSEPAPWGPSAAARSPTAGGLGATSSRASSCRPRSSPCSSGIPAAGPRR